MIERMQRVSSHPHIDTGQLAAAAHELIKQHGEAADIEAAMRADERLAAGDMEGEAVWLRIVKAIAELLDKTPPGDQSAVH